MNQKTYSDYLTAAKTCRDKIITLIKAIEITGAAVFQDVSSNIQELIGGFNFPVCVVLEDEIDFRQAPEYPVIVTMSIVIKAHGTDLHANYDLVKLVAAVLEDWTLGRSALDCQIATIQHDMDAPTPGKAETKTVFSRILIQVSL